MKKVLLLGASSNISSYLIPKLQKQNIKITLFARDGVKRLLPKYGSDPKINILDGNWNSLTDLYRAIHNQDIVFLATGHFLQANKNIVQIMQKEKVNRLIVAGELGINDEIPGKFGQWTKQMLGNNESAKKAAKVILNSNLNYTFMRLAWLYDQAQNENYEIIPYGTEFKNTQVSRQAVAHLVADIIKNPELAAYQNIGVGEPNTYWEKPSFY